MIAEDPSSDQEPQATSDGNEGTHTTAMTDPGSLRCRRSVGHGNWRVLKMNINHGSCRHVTLYQGFRLPAHSRSKPFHHPGTVAVSAHPYAPLL